MIATKQRFIPVQLSHEVAILDNSFKNNPVNKGNRNPSSGERRRIEESRSTHERMISQQPNSVQFWSIYIEHEMRAGYKEEVEKLFQRCLLNVVNVNIFRLYLTFIKNTKANSADYKEVMAKVYEFTLDKIGMDINSYFVWKEYIDFLMSLETVGSFNDKQKLTAIRKIYQRALGNPMIGLDQLWNDICNFETSLNSMEWKKIQEDKNKEFVHVKNVEKEIERITKGINKRLPSLPPSNNPEELKQLEMWREYINYEKGDPLKSEDELFVIKRVMFTYEQCLLCFGLHPQIWMEAVQYSEQRRKQLSESKKTGKITEEEVNKIFERAFQFGLKNSLLIYFSYADLEENRKKYEKVHNIYKRALESDEVDTTLVYIQYMKFVRRTEGITSARKIFKMARDDPRSKYHVYVAAAKLESPGHDGNQIASKIFELATKNFADKNESLNNLRHIQKMFVETGIISDALTSEINVLTNEALDKISAYCFMDLLPCTQNELRSINSTSNKPEENNSKIQTKTTGKFKIPPIISNLLKVLPPTSKYSGPTVDVEALLKNIMTMPVNKTQRGTKRRRADNDDDDDDDDVNETKTTNVNNIFTERISKKLKF